MASNLDELDVRVYLDYQQERKNRFGPWIFATDGTHLDESTAVNCIIDPVSQSVIGTPLPLTPEWKTTFTGKYARYQKSDFVFSSPSTASDWLDIDLNGTGDTYIISGSSVVAKQQSSVKLNGGIKRNQPIFFSFSRLEKENNNNQVIAKIFWRGINFVDRDLSLFFKSDGSCDIYRNYVIKQSSIVASTATNIITGSGTAFNTTDGVVAGDSIFTEDGAFLGIVSITPTSPTSLTLLTNATMNYTGKWHKQEPQIVKSYSRTENSFNANRTLSPIANPNNKFNDVCIIPCRGRDLLVITSFGLNFCHTFDDLNEPDIPSANGYIYDGFPNLSIPAQPFLQTDITPSGDFSIVIPNGKVAFQVAKINFLNNWSIKSKPILLETQGNLFPRFYMPYQQPKKVGTVLSKTYDNKLIGTGTFFTSYTVGSKIYLTQSGLDWDYQYAGTIQSITSNTQLVLTANSLLDLTDANHIQVKKTTGVISGTTSSTTITGSATSFTTELQVGDFLYDNNDRLIGAISMITSNTSLQVGGFPDFAFSNITYWPNVPTYNQKLDNTSIEKIFPINSIAYNDISFAITIEDESGNNLLSVSKPFTSKAYLKLKSYENTFSSSLASSDTSFIHYSTDYIISLKNEVLSNTQKDITSILESLNITRMEDGDMKVSFSARKQNLVDLGVEKPDIWSNRPLKITLRPRNVVYDEVVLFEGYTLDPSIKYIQGQNYDKYSLIEFEANDKKSTMNNQFFYQAPSFDDLEFPIIYDSLYKMSGNWANNIIQNTTAYSDPELYSYSLYFNRLNSSSQYNYTPTLGDSTGSFAEKLRNDIAVNFTHYCKYGWVPDTVRNKYVQQQSFHLINNARKPFLSLMNLYLNEQSALSLESIPVYKGYKRTIRNLNKTYIKPEANRVIIVGVDKSNNERIVQIFGDKDSANPYSLVANRDDSYIGETKDFTYINPNLNTQSLVEKAAYNYWLRLTYPREVIEFDADLLTYFDSTSKITNNETPVALTGFINTFDYSTGVSGVGTLFTTELAIGQSLYTMAGVYLGTIQSIGSNTSLTLTTNASTTLSAVPFTKIPKYIYLNEYDYVDIFDAITIKDLAGNPTIYKITGWEVSFEKDNVDLTNNDKINVRRATYRAEKSDVDPNGIMDYRALFNDIFSNINNCVVGSPISIFRQYISTEPVTFALTGSPPAGTTLATYTSGNIYTAKITWTPSAGYAYTLPSIGIDASIPGTSFAEGVKYRVYNTI